MKALCYLYNVDKAHNGYSAGPALLFTLGQERTKT